MNAPESHELFSVPEGREKLSVTHDSRAPFTSTFTIQREDHTLGPLLSYSAFRSPATLFAGYRVPHPLDPQVQLRIQTNGHLSPTEALRAGLQESVDELGKMEIQFANEMNRFMSQQQKQSTSNLY